MKRLFCLAFLFIHCYICSFAQDVIWLNDDDPIEFRLFKYQVKQIDEFMQRFNGRIDVFELKDSVTMHRNLVSLIDCDYYLENESICKDFINKIVSDSIKLSFYSDNWAALADCEVKIKHIGSNVKNNSVSASVKKGKVLLALKTEQVEGAIYKWVITDAFGDILSLSPKKQKKGLKISPVDNEMNFMSLNHITTEENNNIVNYVVKDRKVSCLDTFLCLVYSGLLNIERVTSITYFFDSISGYSFEVKYFNRDSTNAGWLITKISKFDE